MRRSSRPTSIRSIQSLLPAGRTAIDSLLSMFELERAIYELHYELDHRPDWVPIPVAGVSALLEAP